MTRRNRIFIAILLIYAAGIAFLLYRVVADLDPRYRESAEDALVETSQLLASLIEQDVRGGAIDTLRLDAAFRSLYGRRFAAQIYGVSKTRVELRAYVTDRAGLVLYDSLGRSAGADFSRWRDVSRTLRGGYGARSTPDVEGDARTSVMYVGAPIRWNNEVIGVATVGKPAQSFGQYVQAAREKTLYVGLLSATGVLLLALIVSVWLVRPFGLVSDYIRYVRSQRSLNLPRLGRRALGMLGAAYEEMRDALAGRNYVADYVQTLTHEVKSPLSAIRGAAELLQEPTMDAAQRQRFLANITREAGRIQELVDRMMELTALETRRTLEHVAPVDLQGVLQDAQGTAQDAAAPRGIRVVLDTPADTDAALVEGDAFLLRRAVGNLLDNAIDFSPAGGEVRLSLELTARIARIRVQDQGPGIPEYAQDKVFEKFYSLARPHSRKKSTGLGLAFVKEIAGLHHGRVELANVTAGAPAGGALATLSLPRA
ncbi:two-component system sensor histidine kinase CreC [Ramlibacter tataouinensis]|uniref:histidine kinase n=1 Tax=Ramlibacter tataouinensis (strain ATCC BAA-407 / DSM 14655 / LMG 21543 / TTB310) TaxID=365046 RepID=F5Y2E6_RAMTT|nr:two-component system sensor histidine kinase CreC [Ramlibacter tataouinensis]AEG91120.1 candidate histidine kinase, classic [Ramlibacter tataouinensis TTB310]